MQYTKHEFMVVWHWRGLCYIVIWATHSLTSAAHPANACFLQMWDHWVEIIRFPTARYKIWCQEALSKPRKNLPNTHFLTLYSSYFQVHFSIARAPLNWNFVLWPKWDLFLFGLHNRKKKIISYKPRKVKINRSSTFDTPEKSVLHLGAGKIYLLKASSGWNISHRLMVWLLQWCAT